MATRKAITEKNKKNMLRALEKTMGVVTPACKKVGIDRATHYRWCEKDPEYKLAVDDLENLVLDFAESKLHEQINEKNTTATIFFLKTKGKMRGYIERQELDMSGEHIVIQRPERK